MKESGHNKEKGGVIQTFKRTLSRKDKKNRNKVADELAGDKNRLKNKQTNKQDI